MRSLCWDLEGEIKNGGQGSTYRRPLIPPLSGKRGGGGGGGGGGRGGGGEGG